MRFFLNHINLYNNTVTKVRYHPPETFKSALSHHFQPPLTLVVSLQ